MEPLDPAKNDENSGFSKRRISSILKAPRKSIRFPDPEQQENVVECPKPVEKRNSRRVSFAPANDVLLFSKDVKNASPARSPLQDLITTTAAATQNRVQVTVTEDEIQHITGMETLLNAPLHAYHQGDKVNFDTGADFGEKTVMFSTDDAFMDMTHSHTINIAGDGELLADISLHNYESLPTSGEKTVMFTADNGSMNMTLSHTLNMMSGSTSLPTSRNMDLSVEKRNISSSVPCSDPGFENFLASLSKPSGPRVNPVITRMTPPAGASSDGSLAQIKTKRADVDKENQAPTSVSAMMGNSLNTSRKFGESSYGSALYQEDDVNMDMTEAQTGRIQGFTDDDDDDDAFQCLFPTQEMYSHFDNTPRVSQTAEKNKRQQSSKTLASSNSKDMTPPKNSSLHASHQSYKVNLGTKDEYREKTMFTAGDEERKREACGLPASSANSLDPDFKNFLVSLSKPSAPSGNPAASSRSFGESFNGGTICPENDVNMDMTEAQTGRIIGPTGSDDPFQFLFPTQDMYPHEILKSAGQQRSDTLGSSTGMETSVKPSLNTNVQRHQKIKFAAEEDCREKTVRFSADDACMDVTRSHTVNIVKDLELQSHQNVDFLPACGEKTTRFTANDAAMDMTQCLTVNIDNNLLSASVLPVKKQQGETSGLPRNRSSSAYDLDPGFKNLLMSLSKPVDRSVNPVIARMMPTATQSFHTGDSSVGGIICPEDDVSMDMTEAQTSRIIGITGTDDRQGLLPTRDTMYPQSGHLEKAEMTSQQQRSEALASSNQNDMRTPLSASLKTKVQRHQFDAEEDCREKTTRFTADDACMDVTRSHTVNIVHDLELQSHQNVDILHPCGEKTVRFTANDATMDVTRSHTVNIATDFKPRSHQNVDFVPACGEKTVRFTANDATMDVTRSHTVNIATDFKPRSHQNVDFLPACGEKTVRFTANDATMDVTRSHTVNIATDFKPRSHQNVDFLPACGEKTVRFPAHDAAMDMTQCLTVNIASNSVSDSVLPHQDTNILSTLAVKKRESETFRPRRSRSSSARALDPGLESSQSKTSVPWANPVITKAVAPAALSPQETIDTNSLLDQLKTQKPRVDTENEAPGFVSAVIEKPVNKTMTDCPEDDVSMDITEAQTGHILEQTCTDEPPQCLSFTQDLYPNSDKLEKTEVTSQQSNEALGSSNLDGVEMTHRPDPLDSNESDNGKEREPSNQNCSISAVDHDVDAVPSRKSRRISLADLHSKVRRLSHMINTAPDTIAMDSCTAPLPQLEHDMDKNSKDKTKALPVMEPELEMGLVNTEENTQARCLMQQPSTTPFNLKTKQLMSRLSVGGFKPKLPQRNKPDDPKKVTSVGEHTRTVTVNVTEKLSNFDNDVSDIYDEELDSYEDMSEVLDTRSPQKATEKMSPSLEFNMDEPLEDHGFEQDFISAVHGNKRPLPDNENNMKDEKKIKASTETATDVDMGSQSHVVECDGNITIAPSMTTQTTDYTNSSHTASIRCEATFESTFKQSLFESQLEDYASDTQRKLDDGTITVLEFFKLFNIDFVIHNPRQSILPGRLLSDTDRTPMDLLKDQHINRPKQMVYETNVQNLTEKVEGLKERMQDLDKPLKSVNRPLWEEMRNSSEKGLKSFGAKLKERNNLFRKTSKVQSHEMKEVLYSNLVQANLEEQQRLMGTIEGADEMMKSLDDCIRELETELTAVEEKGFEDTPSLKSRQEEMQKVTEALADNDRQTSELQMQTKQNSNKLNRLIAETRSLESHVTMLHTVNEWKFGEKRNNSTVYTFLHETLHLQLVYEKSNGDDAEKESERKISRITFKLQLDDEKSQCHACLVHQLLSQYVEGETSWVEKYPTSRHVPKLLHDVGLVVSRCRLLGEELRLLKMWGGLRLNILNISCVDTQVHVVFSSLKKCSKFEVIFSVTLINHLCVLQVQSFKNMIGSTTIQQIEEIVASFSPAKNLLTKIVKKIHENLLR